MRISAFFISSLLILAASLSAQPGTHDPSSQLEAMAKLDFLVGTWEGPGWMQRGPGEPHRSLGTETVEKRLGGLVLVIEGTHRDAESKKIVHHALAIIDWDEGEEQYRFRSFLSDGRSTDAWGYFEDGKFFWSPGAPPGMKIRYGIALTESGEWFEEGEMSRDEGKTWNKFFEMRLQRTGS